MPYPRYVVISPVRDEAQHLERTIQSMVRQTVSPVQWIIANDGSSDGTAAIIDQWASKQSWIEPVHLPDFRHSAQPAERQGADVLARSDRGMRARKAKEIDAFFKGYERISVPDWDYLVKLDGDLSFDPDYFEKCFAEFDDDVQLGVGGGVICNLINGEVHPEAAPQFHVRGATKIYRRACWQAIGGVIRGAGWDTLDEVKANMLGWRSRSFPHLKVIHYRVTGAANGCWLNAVKNGIWSYISGYHPAYMMLRCGNCLFDKPYLVSSIGLFYGFVLGYVRRIPQIEDRKLIHYLRAQQLRRMSFRTTIWK